MLARDYKTLHYFGADQRDTKKFLVSMKVEYLGDNF